jgi:predicted TIM-barrel fold metal-dependent hydrolase
MSGSGASRPHVAYRGELSGPGLRLHYGFDGWQEPISEIELEKVAPRLAVAEVPSLDAHVSLECAVTDGERWDNNHGLDYRLWIAFDAVDAHVHASGKGSGALGIGSLRTAMASAGIECAISSWVDNRTFDQIDCDQTRLFPLVWVRPGETRRAEVRARLATGSVGIKLHPTLDDYRADDCALDPYLDIAAEAGCPVACHSAPGEADPDYIRRLAERFPSVPVILYHTFLGPYDGRYRAAWHAVEQPNLYLETSWCKWRVILGLVETVGADRVLFGSDASMDGHYHYSRQPPNVEGCETYNDGLLSLVRALGPRSARKVMGGNARWLFGIDANGN